MTTSATARNYAFTVSNLSHIYGPTVLFDIVVKMLYCVCMGGSGSGGRAVVWQPGRLLVQSPAPPR